MSGQAAQRGRDKGMSRQLKTVDREAALDLTVRRRDWLPPDHMAQFVLVSVQDKLGATLRPPSRWPLPVPCRDTIGKTCGVALRPTPGCAPAACDAPRSVSTAFAVSSPCACS